MSKDEYILDMEMEESQYHCLEMVLRHFDSNEEKAKIWFEIPNPYLGNIKPWVVLITRPEKLEKIIANMVEGNSF